ncbi:MAG TPA: LLM class flavin-dependent oxidoreductase [Amycolatopsis sp.]|nr:LLM class flavin-dependent oxidoreductase [Amycolatopsis sp.]
MPLTTEPLRKLGFLTIGLFDPADPAQGHESTLEIIELGERLGFDSAWVRHRHLQHGISSPVAVLAAASQRTSRIDLGTAVIPLGWENPLRLAEDLATVDILSGGRLNPGVSVGPPRHFDQVKQALYPNTADREDFSYERVRRLLELVRGEPASGFSGTEGFEVFSDRVQPHSPGLGSRLWYGGGSLRSARWAGEHGMNLLTSSVVKAEESEDFAKIQLSHLRTFRAHHPDGERARVSQGLVVIPTDSASPAQRAKYLEYARKRTPRTATPQGPARVMFAPDLVGTSDEIAERLHAHAAFQEIDEVAFALPFTFDHDDYVQILTDLATRLGPALGWHPTPTPGRVPPSGH